MSVAAESVPRTPLHSWIAGTIGVPCDSLTREAITCYQLQKLRQSLRKAQEHSAFYSKHLRMFDPGDIQTLEDLQQIPFTTPVDLATNTTRFLCVSQDEVNRVVTVASSGTSGDPKRLFFSAADQESTLNFFAHGVSTLTELGDRMLIALPCERIGSVGQLLGQGIERFGVSAVPYGLIRGAQHVLETMHREAVTSIIGFPVQLLALESQRGPLADGVFARLNSIVLCSDYVSPSIVRRLRERAGCEVFQHYGMTETGLGGGVDCRAHEGYHLRETDLLFEIVDPRTGEPVADGCPGEVVFSTLTREAMPLIRYRTGDISSFSPQQCACGTCLRTLRYLRGRVNGGVHIDAATQITLADLEDALFALPEVVDLSCSVFVGETSLLEITLCTSSDTHHGLVHRAKEQLERIPAIASASESGQLDVQIATTMDTTLFTGAKRRIEVRTR